MYVTDVSTAQNENLALTALTAVTKDALLRRKVGKLISSIVAIQSCDYMCLFWCQLSDPPARCLTSYQNIIKNEVRYTSSDASLNVNTNYT